MDKGKAWEKKANNDSQNIKNEDYYEMSFNLQFATTPYLNNVEAIKMLT